MDPVFTLQWSEFVLAERLQQALPKKHGYSVWVPVSRQEKGVDLAVMKRGASGTTRTITLQVKASRTYRTTPPKKKTTDRHAFHTWFNRFEVVDDSDFYLLFGQYAPDVAQTRRINAQWYRDMTLLFSRDEMKNFIAQCKTVKTGAPDRMFGFGFDDETAIYQVRGDAGRSKTEYTSRLLKYRLDDLRGALGP